MADRKNWKVSADTYERLMARKRGTDRTQDDVIRGLLDENPVDTVDTDAAGVDYNRIREGVRSEIRDALDELRR